MIYKSMISFWPLLISSAEQLEPFSPSNEQASDKTNLENAAALAPLLEEPSFPFLCHAIKLCLLRNVRYGNVAELDV